MRVRGKLTTTSYVVLGLVAAREPVTSYEMKRCVATSIGYFWPFPHSQLYAEPNRLTASGLLASETEATGRRRRRYRMTPAGTAALRAWLSEPAGEPTEIRDLGMLKLFFGTLAGPGAVAALADEQRAAHERRRDDYARLHTAVSATAEPWELATIEVGLRFETMASTFWAEVRERADSAGTSGEASVADAGDADPERGVGRVDHLPAADVHADV